MKITIITAALSGLALCLFIPMKSSALTAVGFGTALGLTQPGDVADQIRKLADPDPVERARAACEIGWLANKRRDKSTEAAIPALINLLADGAEIDPICCGEDKDRHDWQCLGNKGEKTSPGRQAAMALGSIGAASVDPLKAVAGSRDWRIRSNVAFAFGLIPDDRVITLLLTAIVDSDWRVREQAAWSLGLRGDERAVKPLCAALLDDEWRVREQAAWALGLKGDDRSVEPLCSALMDKEPKVQAQAAWALGLKGDERAVGPLVQALHSSNENLRSQAAWALGLKGDESATEPLAAALKDSSSEVRSQAAWALGLKGDHRAAEALTRAMKDHDAKVRKQATWALGMILMRDPKTADVKLNIVVK